MLDLERLVLKSSKYLHVTIRGIDLELVQNMKYLGVQINYSPVWEEHTKANSTWVSRAVGSLKYA